MTNVLVYSRHLRTPWWRYILSQLDFATATFVLSEFRNDGDAYIMPDFYRHLKDRDIANAGLEAFGPETCDEIIIRCRFLRHQERPEAMRLIGAMVRALEPAIDRADPDLALSFCIDYYAIDIAERLMRRRGVPFVGLSPAVLDGYSIVSARGEHNHVREPSDDEVSAGVAAITGPAFAPFLQKDPRYDKKRFAQMYAYYRAREAAFNVLRQVKRDPRNFHYLLTKPELGWRVRFADRKVSQYLQLDWQARLDATPFARRVFLPLPVYPESTIDYWVRDTSFLPYNALLEEVATTLARAGYVLFTKDHPNMFGFRHIELFERLARIDGVVFVPYQVPSQLLIESCSAVFTSGGTVGLQAALAGRLSMVVDSYYCLDGAFHQLESRDEVSRLPEAVRSFVPPDDLRATRRLIVRHMLSTCIHGSTWSSRRGFDANDPASTEPLGSLVRSLNDHLPGFIRGGTTSEALHP